MTVALAAVAGGVASILTRRPWVTAIITVLAIVAGGVLVTRAPWSNGRLAAELDGLQHLDGFEVIDTTRHGHSWCRPDCPSVSRTWRAPDTSPKATVVVMALALSGAGLAPPYDELPSTILTDRLQVRGSETDVLITAERLEPGDLRVTVVLSSHR